MIGQEGGSCTMPYGSTRVSSTAFHLHAPVSKTSRVHCLPLVCTCLHTRHVYCLPLVCTPALNFAQGHNATDFQRWYKTRQQYEVKYF